MDMRQAFPGAHLKAADLGGQIVAFTIASVSFVKLGDNDDVKPVIKFINPATGGLLEQDLVLNQTNNNIIMEMLGPDSDFWVGHPIQLYSTKVRFGSKMVDGIRVQAAGAAPPGQYAPPAQPGAPVASVAPPGVPGQAPAYGAPPPQVVPANPGQVPPPPAPAYVPQQPQQQQPQQQQQQQQPQTYTAPPGGWPPQQ